MAVGLGAQELHGGQDERVAGASVGEAAVAVVGRAVPVEGDADLDAEFGEEVQATAAQLEPVGVDAQVEGGDAVEGAGEFLAHEPQACRAGQKRFPSVKDDRDGGEFV